MFNLFGSKKKKKPCCCCAEAGENSAVDSQEANANTAIDTKDLAWAKVLGAGCTKCSELKENTIEALESLGMPADVSYITDFAQMAQFGVMSTPALVLGDKVITVGKVLKKEEIAKHITAEKK